MTEQTPDAGRLERLEEDIEDAKQDLAELEGTDDEPRFIDRGTEGGPVDDSIAPPG